MHVHFRKLSLDRLAQGAPSAILSTAEAWIRCFSLPPLLRHSHNAGENQRRVSVHTTFFFSACEHVRFIHLANLTRERADPEVGYTPFLSISALLPVRLQQGLAARFCPPHSHTSTPSPALREKNLIGTPGHCCPTPSTAVSRRAVARDSCSGSAPSSARNHVAEVAFVRMLCRSSAPFFCNWLRKNSSNRPRFLAGISRSL